MVSLHFVFLKQGPPLTIHDGEEDIDSASISVATVVSDAAVAEAAVTVPIKKGELVEGLSPIVTQ